MLADYQKSIGVADLDDNKNTFARTTGRIKPAADAGPGGSHPDAGPAGEREARHSGFACRKCATIL